MKRVYLVENSSRHRHVPPLLKAPSGPESGAFQGPSSPGSGSRASLNNPAGINPRNIAGYRFQPLFTACWIIPHVLTCRTWRINTPQPSSSEEFTELSIDNCILFGSPASFQTNGRRRESATAIILNYVHCSLELIVVFVTSAGESRGVGPQEGGPRRPTLRPGTPQPVSLKRAENRRCGLRLSLIDRLGWMGPTTFFHLRWKHPKN